MLNYFSKIYSNIKDGVYSISNNIALSRIRRKLERGVKNPYRKSYYSDEYSPRYSELRRKNGLDTQKFHLKWSGKFLNSLRFEKQNNKYFLTSDDKPFLIKKYNKIFNDI